jgi:hypothetical protein
MTVTLDDRKGRPHARHELEAEQIDVERNGRVDVGDEIAERQ